MEEPEVGGRERTVPQDAGLELLDVRERADVDGAAERLVERLAGPPGDRADDGVEPCRPRAQDDGQHGVVSRIGHGFRPTV